MGYAFLTLLGGGFVWMLWQLLRRYAVKSCIDHIPGPPRGSFLLGEANRFTDGLLCVLNVAF